MAEFQKSYLQRNSLAATPVALLSIIAFVAGLNGVCFCFWRVVALVEDFLYQFLESLLYANLGFGTGFNVYHAFVPSVVGGFLFGDGSFLKQTVSSMYVQ